ncbi:retrovirus-related pol polyprotein from transposon TNT 1-94 [Tanacetum coccineum]
MGLSLKIMSLRVFLMRNDEKGISHNFASPYTPEQNGIAKRKNRTLIEAARTMLNGSVLSKHFWTEAFRISCFIQNRSIIVKRHNKTPYDIFRERIPDINYFHVFGCLVFIHNHKDHLGKFDAKADDGYFLGYSFVSKAFRVLNKRRQQVKETYHVIFNESMKAIRFTNTSVDEIGNDDSTRYPPDEFIHEDDPSRQYQANSDISYYVIPHGCSLTELTQENHVPEAIAPNEHVTLHTEDAEVERMEAIRIFLSFATYMNFTTFQIDDKSAFLNGKLKKKSMSNSLLALKVVSSLTMPDEKGISICQEQYTRNLLKKYEISDSSSVKTPMVSPNNLGPDLVGKPSVKKQQSVVMSSAKAEYVVVVGCCASILWMKSQLSDYEIHYKMVLIFCDNTNAISISNNPVLHSRTKHIDISYHFIRDYILKGDIELHFILTEYQLADIFTKSLDEPTFTRLKAELGMLNID